MRWVVLVLLAGILATACGSEDRRPRTLVDTVRILGVKAEPPEVGPLQASELSVLAVDPQGRALGVLWLACDPVFDPAPGAAPYSACEAAANLTDPSAAADLFASGAARPLSFDPSAATARWTPPTGEDGAPVDLLAALPDGDPRRRIGGSVTLVVIAAPLADLEAALADPSRGFDPENAAVALKRLTVSEAPTPNANPTLEGVRVGGEVVRDGDTAQVVSASDVPLAALAASGSAEDWTLVHPDGRETAEAETLVASWYATYGDFEAVRSQPGEPNLFFAPRGAGTLELWVVLRDGRGGTDWLSLKVAVAP